MKNAKLALIAALAMTVLNGGRCVVMLFFSVRHLSYETNHPFQKTGEMQATIVEQMQEQLHALQRAEMIHQYQIALYGEMAAIAWNLLLAGLLIFAMSRFQKSN